MSLKTQQWLTHITITVVSLVILMVIKPNTTIEAKGIALPMTKQAIANIKSNPFNPYWKNNDTPGYWINVEYHTTQPSQIATEKVADKIDALSRSAGQPVNQVSTNQFFPTNPILSIQVGKAVSYTNTK